MHRCCLHGHQKEWHGCWLALAPALRVQVSQLQPQLPGLERWRQGTAALLEQPQAAPEAPRMLLGLQRAVLRWALLSLTPPGLPAAALL